MKNNFFVFAAGIGVGIIGGIIGLTLYELAAAGGLNAVQNQPVHHPADATAP